MRKTSEILSDALTRLEGGKRWIQGRLFTEMRLEPDTPGLIRSRALESDSFCSLGAIYRSMAEHGEITAEDTGYNVLDKVDPLIRGMGTKGINYSGRPAEAVSSTNDNANSFDEVKEMFCTGIKNALAEEEEHADK